MYVAWSASVEPDLKLRVSNIKSNFLFFNYNICCGGQKNRLDETVLFSTQNVC